jgi:hypothetical protein
MSARRNPRPRLIAASNASLELAQQDPDVMFQRIIYDGLLGHAFVRMFTVTWDIPGARIVLAPTSLG